MGCHYHQVRGKLPRNSGYKRSGIADLDAGLMRNPVKVLVCKASDRVPCSARSLLAKLEKKRSASRRRRHTDHMKHVELGLELQGHRARQFKSCGRGSVKIDRTE